MINKKNSNRGGALLSVVIVMAIAGILGALAISIAYTNFTMKVIDKKSKDNFYSAEKILEEICVGLEALVSEEYTNAYTEVMENYSADTKSEDMENAFKNAFVINMVTNLQEDNDSSLYKIGTQADQKGLYGFIKNAYGTYSITTTDENENLLHTLDNGLALRNVRVTYKDGNFYNEITTDIIINIPTAHFSKVSAMPEISEFSFIAEGGVDVGGNVAAKLIGKAYSGANISLESGAAFDATDTKSVLLVSKGEVYLGGNATFTTGEKTALWTESIATKPLKGLADPSAVNKITLNGRAYVNDDTTLNAYGDELTLAGQYYGYSNEDSDASASSAIIINGKQTQVDMSNLDTLVLAGTSYVSTSYENTEYTSYKVEENGVNVEYKTEQNVLMGDSIAIKSNQIAYLVPVECDGIVSNPMTHAQYKALTAPDANGNPSTWEEDALDTYLTSIKGKISSYGNVKITPVFVPNKNDGGTVYLYLDFESSEVASEYFMDYYTVNKKVYDNYLRTYLNLFKFDSNDTARIVTRGNKLVPVEIIENENTVNEKTVYTANIAGGTGNVSDSAQELTNYEQTFTALCTKLITDKSSLKPEEKTETVYSNLVDEATIEDFLRYLEDEEIVIKNIGTELNPVDSIEKDLDNPNMREAIFNGDVNVYIVDNDVSANSEYKVSNGKGILIATGDVELKGRWEGLIICGGKLTVAAAGKLEHNPEVVGTAMQMTWDHKVSDKKTETFKVLNFFKSGSEYATGSFDKNADKTDVRNCISYENYKAE